MAHGSHDQTRLVGQPSPGPVRRRPRRDAEHPGRIDGVFRRFFKAMAAFVFPRRCAGCGSFWDSPNLSGAEATVATDVFAPIRPFLCPDCLGGCREVKRPLCTRCGLMFTSRSGEDHRCSECLSRTRPYGMARAVGVYAGGLMHVVHQLKYQGRLALAPAMGRMLGEAYRRYWSECPVDGVLPIPLHRRRLRRRGFNQADLLLRSWLKDAAAAGQPGPARGARILERIRATPPQTGLKRSERRRNIRGAFRVAAHGEIENRRLLLVDDVFTTGATVEEAARVLRAAGAASVDVLTLARTPR